MANTLYEPGISEENDFQQWEMELTSDVESRREPFGTEVLMSIDPAREAGMIACIYGLSSEYDDDDGQHSTSDDRLSFSEREYVPELDVYELN